MKKFSPSSRGTFLYWLWHWMAFNYTARKYHAWQFHHLFHDIEKPIMRLFLPYSKVQYIHRRNSPHHLEYKHRHLRNWIDMVIDWECSPMTKEACTRNARQEALYQYQHNMMNTYEYAEFMAALNKLEYGRLQ